MRTVLNHFLLRNLLVFFVLVSMHLGIKSTYDEPITLQTTGMTALFELISYLLFLVHNLVLYQRLFVRGHYAAYIAMLLVAVVAYQYAYNLMGYLISGVWVGQWNVRVWAGVFWVNFLYVFLAWGVYLAFTYSRERERLLQVANEKKELELKQLNEQLNPHFLFNALNNIYSHLLEESNNGRELILKLSELMRYIIDSSTKGMVPVAEEIRFMEHYIAFEKERLGERCTVNFQTAGINTNKMIVPLILFNFVENAFKHGTTSIRSSTINIRLSIDDHEIHLSVENPVYPASSKSTGLGTENTRSRLDLLYPGKHKLDIAQTTDHYAISLKIHS